MKNLKQFMTVTLMALFAFSAVAGSHGKEVKAGQKDLVDTAHNAGSFTTLVAALKAADLVNTLRGDGPFTVFAPTDEAFEKLPAGTLDDLLKPENKSKLAEILSYHVISGKVKAKDVVGMTSASSVEGSDINISVSNGGVMLNGSSNVIDTDIMTSNGIIHVIDTVIMPTE